MSPAVCDLNSLLSKVKPSTLLPLDDVLTQVRDVAATIGMGKSLLADAAWTPSLKLDYAPEHDGDNYFGFTPRVVPENVTLLPKTTNQINGGGDWSERQVVVKKGETVGSILRELGAAPDEIKSIIAVIGPAALDGGIKEGQKLRVLMTPAGLGHMQPLRVIIAGDCGITAAVALSDLGQYVPVDIRNIDTEVTDTAEDEADQNDTSAVSLYQSLWETALRNNVPKSVIEDLVRIYSYDVDFERKVQPGDSFDVLYSNDENGEGTAEVRYAALTIGGETKKYYRFQTADDGVYDYLRRGRRERQEIPGAQAGADRHRDVAVRLAHASAAPHQRTAYRRRLGCAVRHADLRRRQRRDRGDRAQGRLRQICAHPPRQRL